MIKQLIEENRFDLLETLFELFENDDKYILDELEEYYLNDDRKFVNIFDYGHFQLLPYKLKGMIIEMYNWLNDMIEDQNDPEAVVLDFDNDEGINEIVEYVSDDQKFEENIEEVFSKIPFNRPPLKYAEVYEKLDDNFKERAIDLIFDEISSMEEIGIFSNRADKRAINLKKEPALRGLIGKVIKKEFDDYDNCWILYLDNNRKIYVYI